MALNFAAQNHMSRLHVSACNGPTDWSIMQGSFQVYKCEGVMCHIKKKRTCGLADVNKIKLLSPCLKYEDQLKLRKCLHLYGY